MVRSACMVLAVVMSTGQAFGERAPWQGQGTQKMPFHVTAVRSGEAHDVCASDSDCTATRFIVEGYSDVKDNSTDYVLDCVEITALKPSPHPLVECDRVHAHNDYVVRLMSDAIAFGEAKPHSPDGPGQSAYRIVSEKERTQQKQ